MSAHRFTPSQHRKSGLRPCAPLRLALRRGLVAATVVLVFSSLLPALLPGSIVGSLPSLVSTANAGVTNPTASTTVASLNSSGAIPNASSSAPAISFTGRYIAFASSGSQMVGTQPSGNVPNVYVRDTVNQTNLAVSNLSCTGASCTSSYPSISSDGSKVAFQSLDLTQASCGTGGTGSRRSS